MIETTMSIHREPMALEATLRDYFAARAMQALVRNRRIIFDLWEINDLAGDAYDIADAMLEARKEQK